MVRTYTRYKTLCISIILFSFRRNRTNLFKQATHYLSAKKIWKLQSSYTVSYKNEIFPLQWKVALSWVSGYFIYQLFNPILFQYVGAEVAGQMGMTMQVVNAIQAFAFSWMSTKNTNLLNLYSTAKI